MQRTTDLPEIKQWVQKRGGMPAVVKGANPDEELGLWIEFPGTAEAKDLERVSWEEWYQIFLDCGLAFEFERNGGESRFFRLVHKD